MLLLLSLVQLVLQQAGRRVGVLLLSLVGHVLLVLVVGPKMRCGTRWLRLQGGEARLGTLEPVLGSHQALYQPAQHSVLVGPATDVPGITSLAAPSRQPLQ